MIPLSYAQRRLWFLNQIDPLLWYNSPLVLRLSGALDVGALRAALADVVGRHEALRTVFPEADGQPYQRVLSGADVLEVAGPGFTVADAERHVFDLTCQVPVRAWLFPAQGRPAGSCWCWWCITLRGMAGRLAPLARDLSVAYAARAAGAEPGWEPLPVQYADYALWQRELLGDEDDPGSVFAAQLGYWRQQLAGLPQELALPYDRPRPAVVDHRGGTVPVAVPAALHGGLLELARQDGATLFMVLHAAVAALLTRLGGGTDIPLGTGGGAADEALDELVGKDFALTCTRRPVNADLVQLAALDDRLVEHGLDARHERLGAVEDTQHGRVVSSPRSRSPARRSFTTVAFSVSPSARASGCLVPSMPIPRATTHR